METRFIIWKGKAVCGYVKEVDHDSFEISSIIQLATPTQTQARKGFTKISDFLKEVSDYQLKKLWSHSTSAKKWPENEKTRPKFIAEFEKRGYVLQNQKWVKK